jgi:hypothetical protein
MSLNKSTIEDAVLNWFRELGRGIGHGPRLAPGEPGVAGFIWQCGAAGAVVRGHPAAESEHPISHPRHPTTQATERGYEIVSLTSFTTYD